MVTATVEIGPRPLGVTPIGAPDAQPPGGRGGAPDDVVLGGGHDEMEDRGEAEGLGLGGVTGLVREAREIGVGHAGRVDRESVQPDPPDGNLAVGRVAVAVRIAHGKGPGGDVALGDGVPPAGERRRFRSVR
jgi:hypothetical protein